MINQRQLQTTGPLQSSEIHLVSEQQEVWGQTGLLQQEDVIGAQEQV